MRERGRWVVWRALAVLVLGGWGGALACSDGNGTHVSASAGAAGENQGGAFPMAGSASPSSGQPPTEGGADYMPMAGEGGIGGASAGAGGSPTEPGGAGGAGGEVNGSCPQRPLVGDYTMQAHNEVKTCFRDTLMCAPPSKIEDKTVTFHLYQVRDDPSILTGRFDGPGITLGTSVPESEEWGSPLVYYPDPGDKLDIMSAFTPPEKTGIWEPSRAKAWVRVMQDVCITDFSTGFVHIDIDIATGRVIDFARKCEDDYMTIWYDYTLRGQGELMCAPDACNSVVNDAPLVQPTAAAQSAPLTQGQIYSGTYHLKSIDYQWDASCNTMAPGPAAETLEITATGATSGSMRFVRDEPNQPTVHSTFSYQGNAGKALDVENICGGVVLTPDGFGIGYSASANELRLHETLSCQNGGFIEYNYEKQ